MIISVLPADFTTKWTRRTLSSEIYTSTKGHHLHMWPSPPTWTNLFPPTCFFHSEFEEKKQVMEFHVEEGEGPCPDEDDQEEEHPKEYPCLDCDKIFFSLSKFVRHAVVHTKKRHFSCELCLRSFAFEASLVPHMRIHEDARKFKCGVCGNAFNQQVFLDNHVAAIHGEARPFQCDECEKSFKTNAGLFLHIGTHSEQRPHQCDECDLSFKRTGQLQQHIKSIHTKDKTYVCDVCKKAFSDPSALRNHKATHSDARPFKCTICPNKTYKTNNGLWIHMRNSHPGHVNKSKVLNI